MAHSLRTRRLFHAKRRIGAIVVALALPWAIGCAEKKPSEDRAATAAPPKGLLADDDAKARIPKGNNTFGKFEASGIAELAPYAKVSDDAGALPNTRYPQVVRQFYWWLRYALQTQCVPDPAFVEKQVRLIPAAKTGGKEDVAFLSYEMAGKTWRILQTGGLRARIWIFIDDPTQNKPRSSAEAATIVMTAVRKYISEKLQAHLPTFATGETDALFVGQPEPGQDWSKVNHARWYLTESVVCLSVQKADFGGPAAAHVPLPNEWFSYGKEWKE